MMGWHISVYRQADGGHSPASARSPEGIRVAVWQADPWGLLWLRELAAEGKAINLGGDGYPYRFTATAEHLVPRILEGPPSAWESWSIGDGVVIDPELWVGKTLIDHAAARECRFDEWLLVVVWDES